MTCAHDPYWRGQLGGCMACRAEAAEAQVTKLTAFKKYVHDRLDAMGVPENPDPVGNKEHGCRIEGRLNWLLDRELSAGQGDDA